MEPRKGSADPSLKGTRLPKRAGKKGRIKFSWGRFWVILSLSLAGFGLLLWSVVGRGVIANMVAQLDSAIYSQFLGIEKRLQKDISTKQSNVVIVGICDRTLTKMGAYNPATYRRYHVEALKNILRGKPKAVVYDILFSDPHPDPLVDEQLGEAMTHGSVFAAHYATPRKSNEKSFEKFVYPNAARLFFRPIEEEGFYPVPAPIFSGLTGVGLANAYPDADGMLRKMPMLISVDDKTYPAISLEVYRALHKLDRKNVRLAKAKVKVGEMQIPVDNRCRTRIPMLEGEYLIREVPFYDVYHNRIPEEFFRDKIVFVAATATGLGDNKLLPYYGYVPGVKVHANLLLALEKDRLLYEPSGRQYYILVFCTAVFFTFFFFRKKDMSRLEQLYSYITSFILIKGLMSFVRNKPRLNRIDVWWTRFSQTNYGIRFFLLFLQQTRNRLETLLFQLIVVYVAMFLVYYFLDIYIRPTPILIQVLLCNLIVREFKRVDVILSADRQEKAIK